MTYPKITKPLSPARSLEPLLSAVSILLLSACASAPTASTTDAPKVLERKAAKFSDLPGWSSDDQSQALPAFARSCARILKIDPVQKPSMSAAWAGPISDWQTACRALPQGADAAMARRYFETYFTPVALTAEGEAKGLFTGYYQASLKGSRTAQGPYTIPLRARPDDLVMVNLGEFREELKGQRIAGRVIGGQLKVYEDRAAIEDGRLPQGQDKPLLYVDSAVDAFFLQIQGSGLVRLPDGSTVALGYDGQNGHPYYAIGKELVKRGYLAKDDVSMQSIRVWLAQNPVEGREIMRTNKSYVFFKVTEQQGAVGGEGLELTPGRSLAIDHSLIPYGLPYYLDADPPRPQDAPLQRLMVAQDTGGAIRGPVRGDVFWGYGDQAEAMAGPMKAPGRGWVLLPKSAAR